MHSTLRLSLIITTYNRPDALRRVLEAVAEQSRLPDEVLVADDGSGDSTRACIEAFRLRMPFPTSHVWHPDDGFRAAAIRNRAIRTARHDYLIFLDGDCIPERHFIRDHHRLMADGCFVQGGRVLLDRSISAHIHHRFIQNRRFRLFFSKHVGNRHHLIRLPWLPPSSNRRLSGIRSCNIAFFKSDLYAVNGFNEAFTGWGREDSELVARLYNAGRRRRTHPFAAVCFHLWHPALNRSRLAVNDQLLAETVRSRACRCRQGLV